MLAILPAAAAFAAGPRVGMRAGMPSSRSQSHGRAELSAPAGDNPFEAFRYAGARRSAAGADAPGSLHSERKRPASPARGGSAASPAKRTKGAAGDSPEEGPAKTGRKKKGKPAPKARLCEPPALPNFDGWLPVYERGPAGAVDAEILPFVSGVPGGWRERWCGVCDDCFEKGQQCFEYPEVLSLSLSLSLSLCVLVCMRACARAHARMCVRANVSI